MTLPRPQKSANGKRPFLGTVALGLALMGLEVGSSGCSMVRATADNLVYSPLRYHRVGDENHTRRRNEKIARDAWYEVQKTDPQCAAASADYRAGFEAGYVDHLTYGGHAAPPVVPPKQYWNLESRYGDWNDAAREWLSGFECGSRLALATGIRTGTIVPSTGGLSSPDGVASATDSAYRTTTSPSSSLQNTPGLVPPEPDLERSTSPRTPPIEQLPSVPAVDSSTSPELTSRSKQSRSTAPRLSSTVSAQSGSATIIRKRKPQHENTAAAHVPAGVSGVQSTVRVTSNLPIDGNDSPSDLENRDRSTVTPIVKVTDHDKPDSGSRSEVRESISLIKFETRAAENRRNSIGDSGSVRPTSNVDEGGEQE